MKQSELTRQKPGKLVGDGERFRELVDRLPGVVFETDEAGNISFLNQPGLVSIGYSVEDLRHSLSVFNVIAPEDHERVRENMRRVMNGERLGLVEYTVVRKDGTRYPIGIYASPVIREGKLVGVSGLAIDVTELKGAEQALRASEARYRRLFESSPISLWEEDFSDVKKYFDDLRSRGVTDFRSYIKAHPGDLALLASMVKIVDVNETTLNLYGAKSVEELRGELRRIFTREVDERFREEIIALGEGKTRFESEFDNQSLTGETKYVSLILSVIPGYEGTLRRVLVSIIDLTERRKMEQRLQQAERLAAIGETAAMVGHDLRNPLQGIAGAVNLLKDGSVTEKEREELLRLIQQNVSYADGIVRDLSDYSSGIQLTLAEATPKSIVANVMGIVRVPSNVTVQDLSEDQPTVRVDLGRIRRSFINLVENAIDAMPQGGVLTIASRRSNGNVEISVTDTGPGMPESMVESLWRPFQTTKAKGMGLGLAICKRIVEAHGGKIFIKTKVGEGTTMTVRLPIRTEVVEVKPKWANQEES